MKKRKRCHTDDSSAEQCRNQSNDDRVIPPIKGFPKSEIQELIRQEIFVVLKQLEKKMDELIGRMQKMECSSSYEAQICKLQAAIRKLKRREQAAFACMRNLQLSRTQTHRNTSSPAPTKAQTGSVLAVSKTTDNLKAASSTSETVLTTQGFQEVQMDESTTEGFHQKQVNANLVDLTSEGNTENITALNSNKNSNNVTDETVASQKKAFLQGGGTTGVVPGTRMEPVPTHVPLRNWTCCHAKTPCGILPNRQATAQGAQISALHLDHDVTGIQPAQSKVQNDWKSKLPPLPVNPFPASLPHTAAMTNLPQKLQVKLAWIQKPSGIGVLWTVDNVDSCVAPLDSYSLYFTQEDNSGYFLKWKNIGVLKAMPLPMACKITAFAEGHRICVSVVAKDVYGRYGPYSEVQTISSCNTGMLTS